MGSRMTELIEILRSGPAVSAATVAILGAMMKMIKSLFEFNDEHLQKRQLKKLAFLAKECEKNDVLHRLIESTKDEEVFRNAFGRTGSPQFIDALTRAYKTGKFSLSELRISSPYLEVKNKTLVVELGLGAHTILYVAIGLVVIMGLYIAALLLKLFSVPSGSSYAAALVLIIFYVLFAWLIGGDAREVLIAKRVRNKLAEIEIAP